MSEPDFSVMNDAAKAMCASLASDPWRWREDPCSLVDTKTGVEYWLGSSGTNEIISTWDGHTQHRVFSVAQGLEIQESLQKMRRTKASEAQLRVAYSFMEAQEAKEPKGCLARILSCIPWVR